MPDVRLEAHVDRKEYWRHSDWKKEDDMTRYTKTNILRLSTLAAFALAVILATSAAQAQSSLWETKPSFELFEPQSIIILRF